MSPRAAKPADAVSGEYAELLDRASKSYPVAVILGDGESIAGEFVRLDSGPTRDYGNQPVVVFIDAADQTEKCIWLLHQALKSQFKAARPEPGEKFVVVHLGKRAAKKSQRDYNDYRVVVAGRDADAGGGAMSFEDIETAPDEGAPESE